MQHVQEEEEQRFFLNCKQHVSTVLRGWVFREVYTLIKLAVPVILTLFFQQLLVFVSILFVGHISGRSLELDSAALATSFINVTGFSVGIGLSSAADTLCSQSYGYKNYKRVGHVFQRGVLILFLLCLFVWTLWLNTESFLLLLQQQPCVARLTGVYVQIYCLGLPPMFLYIMLQKYLQAQSIVWPFILTGVATNIINAAMHAILIFGVGLGIPGAALSMVISNYCQPFFLIVYVWARKLHKLTWDGWSWESLRGWWQFLKLGLPGIVMICVEWVSFEVSAFVLGSIDEVQLGINAVLISIIALLAMAPVGLSISVTIRVGNELGAGQPQRAKRAAYVGVALAVCNGILTVIFLQSTRTVIGTIFTSNEAIIKEIPIMIHIISPAVLTDQFQFLIAGVLRGSGRQFLGAGINAFSYYVFGLPIGISLALATDLGIKGMWIGLNIANFIQAVCFGVTLLLTNWQKEADKAVREVKTTSADENQVDKDTVSVSSTVSEDLSMKETALLSQDEPGDEFDKVQEEDDDVSTAEEAFLVEESPVVVKKRAALVCCQYPRTKVGLLLCRGSLFVLGAALVIGAGVSSQYHPPVTNGNYSECSANTSNDTDDELVSYSIDAYSFSSMIAPKTVHSLTTTYTTARIIPTNSDAILNPSVTVTVNPTPS